MNIKKLKEPNIREMKKSFKEGARIVIIKTPTYMYDDKRLLYGYEIFTNQKKLAKKIKKIFKCHSIGRPITTRDYFTNLWYRVWEKIRRKLNLGGAFGFGMMRIYKDFYSLIVVAEERIERKLKEIE